MTGVVLTARLRLEPITVDHADDLWIIHNDEGVARWYGGWKHGSTPSDSVSGKSSTSTRSGQSTGRTS